MLSEHEYFFDILISLVLLLLNLNDRFLQTIIIFFCCQSVDDWVLVILCCPFFSNP